MAWMLAAGLLPAGSAIPASGGAGAVPAPVHPASHAGLRSISAWLRDSGAEGWLDGEVADAAGIPRGQGEPALEVSQRGFRSDGVLRVAQLSADGRREFLLFMVQRPEGEVFFYVAGVRDGLRKAFVSLPAHQSVVPLSGPDARASFEREIAYWEARAAGI